MKTSKIALDTNILIYFFEDVEPYSSAVEGLLRAFMKRKRVGVISTINIAEILTGFYVAGEEEKAKKAKMFFKDLTCDGFEITPVTFEIADLAANLRAKRGGKLPDALIVATAINRTADRIYSQDEDLFRFSEDIKVSKLSEKLDQT